MLGPQDDGYAEAAASHNTAYVHRPALVALPENTAQVVEAVEHANRIGLPIAVQSTGHGARRSYDGAMLINTSRLLDLDVDPAAATVRVGAGVRWQGVLDAAAPHGLGPLCGTSGEVGVVGYTLGGGMGWLTRQYGLCADHVRAVELVSADGKVLRASPDENSDLFDALLGSGASLVVVTALELDLFPVTSVFGGGVSYPLERAREVTRAYRDWTVTLPPEVSTALTFMRMPPAPSVPEPLRGRGVVSVVACVNGDQQHAEQLLAPVRDLPEVLVDTFQQRPYQRVGEIMPAPPQPVPTVSIGAGIRALTDTAIDHLLAEIDSGAGRNAIIQIRHLGSPPPPGSRLDFGYWDGDHVLFAFEVTPTPADVTAAQERLRTFTAALRAHATGAVPITFAGTVVPASEVLRAALPAARYDRLAEAKRSWDPENRLSFGYPVQVGTG
jgi:FAD/FMN-containing dehydrogenase